MIADRPTPPAAPSPTMSLKHSTHDPNAREWDVALVTKLDCSYDFNSETTGDPGTVIYDPDNPEAWVEVHGQNAPVREQWQ